MANEKKPGWITAIAVVAIIFSCFGLLNGSQEIIMPQMLEFQKEMFGEMTTEIRREIDKQPAPSDPSAQGAQNFVLNMFDKLAALFDIPEWYKGWLVISGILSLLVNGFYLLAAILFLQLKPRAIPLMYIALILSISLGITKTVVAVNALSSFAMMMMSGSLLAIVIEIILIIVIATGDKSPFKQPDEHAPA